MELRLDLSLMGRDKFSADFLLWYRVSLVWDARLREVPRKLLGDLR